jgi:hypothetical protein
MELPALRMLKLTGSKSLVLRSSRSTFSGMSTRITKLRLVLVLLIAMEMPSMINRAVKLGSMDARGLFFSLLDSLYQGKFCNDTSVNVFTLSFHKGSHVNDKREISNRGYGLQVILM